MKPYKIKEEKAITLVALIVTIVVIFIIASITINATLGENGIINRAKAAKEETIIAMEKEQIALAYLACITNIKDNEIVTAQRLEDELKQSKNDVTVTEYLEYLKVVYNNTAHIYIVDKYGNIRFTIDENAYKEEKNEVNIGLINQNETIDYSDSLETLTNPDRGLYTPVSIILKDTNEHFFRRY